MDSQVVPAAVVAGVLCYAIAPLMLRFPGWLAGAWYVGPVMALIILKEYMT